MVNGPFSRSTQVSQYQNGKTNLDFTEAKESEWQWHQLGHVQVCMSLQTDNHASILPITFLQAGCPSFGPNNSIKALKAYPTAYIHCKYTYFTLLSDRDRTPLQQYYHRRQSQTL